ncbi:MAG: LysE family transporter [Duncaniella sp.]|nr:LysE family transporter [Duncaniella sp.]
MLDFLVIMLRGLLIGVLISAPMGPIGVLCIQRTLNKGRWPAFCTGVGAGLSDLIYCLLTGLGLSFVTDFIENNLSLLQIIGSLFLIAYGVYLFGSNPSRQLRKPPVQVNSYWKDFVTGFLFTFSNPLILFFIIALFARFSFLAPEFRAYHYVAGYVAIFGGAILWWLFVTYFVNKVRAHFNVRSMWLVNRIIAVILLVMAAVGFVSGIRDIFHF